MKSRLYCTSAQLHAVMAMLDSAGLLHERIQLQSVSRMHELQGLEGVTLVYVENHPNPVPYEMLIYARAMGMVEMKLNDEAARARHRRQFVETCRRDVPPPPPPTTVDLA